MSYQQACEAVIPDRYPADEKGIRIDLAHVEMNEEDPEFWGITFKHIDRSLARHIDSGLGPDGHPLNHLLIFAFAPIPALIYLGKQLGDTVSADVFQRHRNTSDWRWHTLDDVRFRYVVKKPPEIGKPHSRVALVVSLSGTIRKDEIRKLLGDRVPMYRISIARPHRDYLQAKEQLELFRNEWYALLSQIREVHGESCEIHLFPAVPNSVAVEIGRSLLPKSDPGLVVYDHSKKNGGFSPIAVI
ncbi:MAG: SAVED domain-containing protein [Anaerolineales bacterium]